MVTTEKLKASLSAANVHEFTINRTLTTVMHEAGLHIKSHGSPERTLLFIWSDFAAFLKTEI